MLKFPREKVIDRFDVLPEHVQQLLTSDELTDIIWTIGEAHHLGEERTGKLASIMGAIILGFLHVEDLAKEIIKEAQIDKRLAAEVAHELQIKILNPLLPEINAAFNYHITGMPAAVPPAQPEIMRPSFAPPSNVDQPFILHEEQKETDSVRPRDETLVRPSFYTEPDISNQSLDIGKSERPMAARLEIGDTGMKEWATDEPKVGKTEEPPIRVVHYSGPQTPVDPFGNQASGISNQSLESANQKPDLPKDIHPENVVDLKDLPK